MDTRISDGDDSGTEGIRFTIGTLLPNCLNGLVFGESFA
jgi:hypothetical protein